jgi:NAD(P)-dependent dehydrogenase (short-subunit alcohol dehydrogenase family)
MYGSLQGQVVLITGATGGLGPAVVERFHAEGAKLALADRSEGKIDEMFGALGEILPVNNTDVTNEDSVNAMAEYVQTHFGHIDALINIAGGYRAGTPVHETELSQWDFMMNLNAKSVFLTSRAVVPYMMANNIGVIINVGSNHGLNGAKNSAAYSASKSAVFRITESMAGELKGLGIRVNAIIPSMIDTPANRASSPNADYSKWVKPESIAGVIAFLASNEARDITGALLSIPGGS